MVNGTRPIRTLRAGVFNLQTVEFSAGFRLPEHSHDWSCLQVVLRGGFMEHGIGASDSMGPGTLIYRPAGLHHENPELPSRSVSLCVQLAESACQDLFPTMGELNTPQLARSPDILTIAGRVREELEHPDDVSPAVAEAACVQLLGSVVRRSRGASRLGDDGLIRRAQALIESGVLLKVERVAQTLGVSRHRLNRAFTRAMGCSVGIYLRRHRLLEARRLLEETRRSIAEVALMTGFADQSHLTRQFRSVFGRTPARMRGGPRAPIGGTC